MTQPHQPGTYHVPVLLDEVVAWLEPAQDGWILDGTFGGGGHSHALVDRYPNVHVVGVDRDPDALAHATPHPRITLVEANYRDLASVVGVGEIPDHVDAILLDLGVSSHQFDSADRGFSYRNDGPIDMRMGSDAGRSAAEIVNAADVDELTRIIGRYGEERFARRIARAIVTRRPFRRTGELAECIAAALPAAARRGRHPARKTFQALRIAVNDELAGLEDAMESFVDVLTVGGRVVVIAYHSLEDRIVKRALRDLADGCVCPDDLPVCACGAEPQVRVLTRKPIRPDEAEIVRNPRARSAVLRVAERLAS